MAEFFVAIAMIYCNVVGNLFKKDGMIAWGEFLGALIFPIWVLLTVFTGSEMFTGNNFLMVFGAFEKWNEVAKVWIVSYIGNFIGCFYYLGSGCCQEFQVCRIIFLIWLTVNLVLHWVRCFFERFFVISLSVW